MCMRIRAALDDGFPVKLGGENKVVEIGREQKRHVGSPDAPNDGHYL